jgi:hypothetical protein
MASNGVSRLDPERSRAKRASNLTNSLDLLTERGFRFEQKSPTHFVVEFGESKADFWPTTGQYAVRVPKGSKRKVRYLRGVFNLMRDMKK